MRSRLFWKLFAVQLLAAAVLILGALIWMRWNTAHNFSVYLDAKRRDTLQDDAARIAQAYGRTHDLQAAGLAIPALEPRPLGPDDQGPPGPPPPPFLRGDDEDGPPRGPPPRRPPPPFLRDGPPEGAAFRPPPLQLQDADRNIVGGSRRPIPEDDIWREPIVVDGSIVGYLAQPILGHRVANPEAGFAQAQTRGLWLIGGIAIAFAGLVAAFIGGLVLRPLRLLSAGTTALAQRRFDTRLHIGSDDELGRLAGDFNRLAESLGQYDTRQKQWLADVAHELRTPLAVLRGELEAVIDGVRKAEPATIRSLHQEVHRISTMVDDLHLLSLADSGGLRIDLADFSVNTLITETVERFRERFAKRGFRLELQTAASNAILRADGQRMEQVLANLLENILRHAQPVGPVIVSAAVASQDAPQDSVHIRVSDAGPGVPTASLPRLFDRLYRVDASRTRASGGSGLGLAICRSIVEAQGGTIVARHSERGGLEIELTLPSGGDRKS